MATTIAGVMLLRMPLQMREGRQLCLFENAATAAHLDDWLWCRSFDRPDSLQSLAPYASRLRPNLVRGLLDLYTAPADVVLDPFAGSGVVPFEAAIAERHAWASDLNPYACAVTQGKLAAPVSDRAAVQQAEIALDTLKSAAIGEVPTWVQEFFHPDTLRETIATVQALQQQQNHFAIACLLGILHHSRPGFLSYPTSYEAPYLRRASYPLEEFPQLYGYRDVRSRLFAKIKRSYRHHGLPQSWPQRQYRVWQADCRQLPIADISVDAILTQPPHPGAFDSVRDQRLRLWLLGHTDWRSLDATLLNHKTYADEMRRCLQELARVLKRDRPCILIVSDILQHGRMKGIAERLADLAIATSYWTIETFYDDLPTSQPTFKSVKVDRVVILRRR